MIQNVLFLHVLFLFNTSLWSQNLFDLDHSKEFADFLYQTRQYDAASREYERILIYDQSNEYQTRVIRSYRLAKKYDFAVLRMNDLFPNKQFTNTEIKTEAHKLYMVTADYKSLRDVIDMQSSFGIMSENMLRFKSAKPQLPKRTIFIYPLENSSPQELTFYNTLKLYDAEKWKKPWLAACMSAIVPGSGRVYAGDWKNALVSAMFIGINGYQAYSGFRKNGVKSVSGWIFGSITAGFYLGNIYGSAWTAKRKNQQKYERYQKTLDDIYYNYIP
jgi:hypothetical protein